MHFKATLKFLMYGVKVKFFISRIYTNRLIEQKKRTRKMSPGITKVLWSHGDVVASCHGRRCLFVWAGMWGEVM